MENRHARKIILLLSLVLIVGMLAPGSGYSQFQPGQKRIVGDGQELSVKGVILNRDGDMIVLRDLSRTDTVVVLTDNTKIRTEQKWLFHGRRPFDVTVLIPGLIVTAEGKGAHSNLVADVIEFSEADLNAAMTAYAQTAPIARQAAENKKQVSATKQQLSETDRKLAETSQEVVDTNKRINEIDQYELVKTVAVLFALNGAKLSDDAKAQLDELASKAPSAKNYLVEVEGYADTTGKASRNLELSQDRADAVVQYLTVKHNIPLRRITMPMGYGETKASDMSTAAGRAQERRVEVRILVNKGLNK
jgi:outer membrane protein OmpA-like peptidoglycan-associated protein